ncbi:MAG: D-alanyl-D-alanine carboxypeptidase [Ruminococcaceae bacterium]|nr:D-alanyl-D-alanine carboxypeptidase [Oscillospiraceae bacterium]
MKRLLSLFMILLTLSFISPVVFAAENEFDIVGDKVPSAILIEAETGTIIFQKDAYSHRAPASVTKIMTMLLAAEAVDAGFINLDDPVTASARAAGMGGSQIWLEEGEIMSFGEMLKCITMVSANDCCVAIAEHLSGSEEAFAVKMNEKAAELGLKDSNFVCCSGLSDSDEHYSCAYDLAIISRELLKHDFIKEYTKIWTDSIRGGEFTLNNTNKLIYHYSGSTGLKTGFTSKAGHCLAASAERDGVEYIAVVLGCESSSSRFEGAKSLLNYGFTNYTLVSAEKLCSLPPVIVKNGKKDCLNPAISEKTILIKKEMERELRCIPQLPEEIYAPVNKGQQLGKLQIMSGDTLVSEIELVANETIYSLGYWDLLGTFFSSIQNFLVIQPKI